MFYFFIVKLIETCCKDFAIHELLSSDFSTGKTNLTLNAEFFKEYYCFAFYDVCKRQLN